MSVNNTSQLDILNGEVKLIEQDLGIAQALLLGSSISKGSELHNRLSLLEKTLIDKKTSLNALIVQEFSRLHKVEALKLLTKWNIDDALNLLVLNHGNLN